MAEPLIIGKITVSALSIVTTTIGGCITAYKGYKLTQSFGEDWVAVERRLAIQHGKLTALYNMRISWFKNELANEQGPHTIAIRLQLVEIATHFNKCIELIKKYHDVEEELKKMPEKPEVQVPTTKPSLWKRITKRRDNKKNNKARPKDEAPTEGAETTSMSSVSTTVDLVEVIEMKNPVQLLLSTTGVKIGSLPEQELVVIELDKATRQAGDRQRTLGLYNRVRWWDHDRETLLCEIPMIQDGISELDRLLELRGIRDSQIAFAHSVPTISATEDNKVLKGRYCFAIQVSEEPESLAEELTEQLSQADTSLLAANHSSDWAWGLHAHPSWTPESAGGSILLYALTSLLSRSGEFESASETALDLGREHQSHTTEHTSDYKICRTIGIPEDQHHLIIHSGGKWHQVESLRDVFQARGRRGGGGGGSGSTETSGSDGPSGKEPELPAMQPGPSLTVAERLFLVYRATEQSPRPEHVIFYGRAPDEEARSRIFSPYVSIGLGRSSKNRVKLPLGTVSGLSKVVANPVAELGLVLFQVGSATALNYSGGETVEREELWQAIKEARLRMHEVAAECGPDFAEAVALCLDKNKSIYEPPGEGDFMFIERLRASLWERDTATIP
ncbi:hypothetical protein B0H67DRAFT_558780 [Lasiosphaeris hirsuta]|uniref:Prion-inhibition and propagation HeLo domain-containing protein n=1 Tax=Lasiosphaeris hirsuta TaxID=260670 RepID=A0AA39ZPS1_9PEZI|nr:hypothetical protein B0H67DRAFT_558780 [Lasiosphaeris hirsuta]